MKLIIEPISIDELRRIAKTGFGNMVKAVVDIEKSLMVIDADLHADEEALLLEQGSLQQNLWGINLYPDEQSSDFIEFDSMINLRPSQNNFSRNINDKKIRKKIAFIVNKLIIK